MKLRKLGTDRRFNSLDTEFCVKLVLGPEATEMRKDKDALILVGIVIAFVTCGFGIWWLRQHPITTEGTESAMEKARNADTSNFDTVLRF